MCVVQEAALEDKRRAEDAMSQLKARHATEMRAAERRGAQAQDEVLGVQSGDLAAKVWLHIQTQSHRVINSVINSVNNAVCSESHN